MDQQITTNTTHLTTNTTHLHQRSNTGHLDALEIPNLVLETPEIPVMADDYCSNGIVNHSASELTSSAVNNMSFVAESLGFDSEEAQEIRFAMG